MKDGVQMRCERENEEWKKRSAGRSIKEILNPRPGAGDVAHFITVRDRRTFTRGGLLGDNRPEERNVCRCAFYTAHIDYTAIALHSALMTEEWNIYMPGDIR